MKTVIFFGFMANLIESMVARGVDSLMLTIWVTLTAGITFCIFCVEVYQDAELKKEREGK